MQRYKIGMTIWQSAVIGWWTIATSMKVWLFPFWKIVKSTKPLCLNGLGSRPLNGQVAGHVQGDTINAPEKINFVDYTFAGDNIYATKHNLADLLNNAKN